MVEEGYYNELNLHSTWNNAQRKPNVVTFVKLTPHTTPMSARSWWIKLIECISQWNIQSKESGNSNGCTKYIGKWQWSDECPQQFRCLQCEPEMYSTSCLHHAYLQ
jgi:hypothetical protein